MKGSILNHFIKSFGVGKSTAIRMCQFINVAPNKPLDSVSALKQGQALAYITAYKKVGFPLQASELANLLYHDQIGSWKGLRLKAFLPVNGQRTKTNGITARKRAQILTNQIANIRRDKAN